MASFVNSTIAGTIGVMSVDLMWMVNVADAGRNLVDGKLSYRDFVWFLISEEDKRHPRRSVLVSLFLAADLARTTVGLFITLARQSGTRCQMNLEIQDSFDGFRRYLKTIEGLRGRTE